MSTRLDPKLLAAQFCDLGAMQKAEFFAEVARLTEDWHEEKDHAGFTTWDTVNECLLNTQEWRDVGSLMDVWHESIGVGRPTE